MPKYELMYIVASSVSDDQIPSLTEQVKKYVSDFGGTEAIETQLGKKKLAYPIKKTRNGHYVVINFDMAAKNVAELDAKIRAQDSTIIRYIIVNLDEHLAKLEKDKEIQAKMPKRILPEEQNGSGQTSKTDAVGMVETKPSMELNEEELDKKIEEALTEDITK
jgi:small subunit ribosomal protein S6